MKPGDKKPRAAQRPGQQILARSEFSRFGKNGLIYMSVMAIRDSRTGKSRFAVTIPNADRVVFPDDLGVLLQTFGWAMATLDMGMRRDSRAWSGCCDTVCRVEHCLRLE